MTDDVQVRAHQLMHEGDSAVWSIAALSLVLSGRATEQQRVAAHAVLAAHGLTSPDDLAGLDAEPLAAQVVAPLLQAAALVSGGAGSWAEQSGDALRAQGRASAQGAAGFKQWAMPRLTGVQALLETPGARLLDVGTGVAALAVAWAQEFPQLTVVGLDVSARVLAMAAETVAASAVQARVVLREQDVSTLDEEDVYALAWLPAPFLPERALKEGAVRVARALVAGGWLIVGHGKFGGEPLDDMVSRFKTVVYGGTALDDEEARGLLTGAGLTDVFTLPTPPGAPALTYGRKPIG